MDTSPQTSKNTSSQSKSLRAVILLLVLAAVLSLAFSVIRRGRSTASPPPRRAPAAVQLQQIAQLPLYEYSREELESHFTIPPKYEEILNEMDVKDSIKDGILSDLRSIVRSFPGRPYDTMEFDVSLVGMTGLELGDRLQTAEISVGGRGSIDGGWDDYGVTYTEKRGQLARSSYTVSRAAIPDTIKEELWRSLRQDSDAAEFFGSHPTLSNKNFSVLWRAAGEPTREPPYARRIVPQDEGYVFYIVLAGSCHRNNWRDCGFRSYDVYSVRYVPKEEQFIKSSCLTRSFSSSCKPRCESTEAIDYGFVCPAASVCCEVIAQ